MTFPKPLLPLLTSLAIAFLGVFATAAPKAASHVQEQDVTLDEDSDDAEAAPKKKHPNPALRTEAGADGDLGPAVWLSLGLIGDAMFISGSDVCTEKSQVSGGFTCTRGSGSQYHGTPLAGSGGKVSGISFAPLRVTVGVSARLAQKISAGIRLGYAVLGQGPRPDGGNEFLAFSAEVQGAYWFSQQAFSTNGIGPFVELSGGLAEIDGHSKVTVREDTSAPPPVSQLDNPPQQSLDAYQKAGAGFAGAGAGLFIPFGARAGLVADLRVLQLFPSSGTALSLGVSGALGL
ncbi:MAG TPA: hypothetical protein VHC69_02000 [Polyangiaceae bacterium]|nr:hypothetical protein [Polyangiaceae bacterium]